MSFYFECEVCGYTEEFASNDTVPNTVRNCEDCGQDGCVACIDDGACVDCFERREDDAQDAWDDDDAEAED